MKEKSEMTQAWRLRCEESKSKRRATEEKRNRTDCAPIGSEYVRFVLFKILKKNLGSGLWPSYTNNVFQVKYFQKLWSKMYNQREKNRSVYIKTCPQQPFEVFHFVHFQILLDTNRTYSAPIGAEFVRKKYDRTDSALFGVWVGAGDLRIRAEWGIF